MVAQRAGDDSEAWPPQVRQANAVFEARVALLRQAYAAFNRREIDAVLALLAPDVPWPDVAQGTTLHGHAAVRAYWEQQVEKIDPRVEPLEILPFGETVIVRVHQVVRDRSGSVLAATQVAHAYTFRGDVIATMTVQSSGSAAAGA